MQTKEKYQLEVTVNASPQLIYQYISTPAGLKLRGMPMMYVPTMIPILLCGMALKKLPNYYAKN